MHLPLSAYRLSSLIFAIPLFVPLAPGLASEDVVTAKLMSLELARDIAQAAVNACRKERYQVPAVVVDRAVVLQAIPSR